MGLLQRGAEIKSSANPHRGLLAARGPAVASASNNLDFIQRTQAFVSI